VDIDVSLESSVLELAVQDNGKGATPGTADGNGLGNMRMRLEAIGGRVSFPPSEVGMRVELTAPVS